MDTALHRAQRQPELAGDDRVRQQAEQQRQDSPGRRACSDSTAPTDTTQRKAADLVNDAFGAGRLAPMLTVVDGRNVPADRPAAYQKVVEWAGSHDDVANAQLGGMNPDGSGALILITPAPQPGHTTTENLLDNLRDRLGTRHRHAACHGLSRHNPNSPTGHHVSDNPTPSAARPGSRVVVMTGATSGIGPAALWQIALPGNRVIVGA
jgi:uncharacterized membrane protein YdfJ with MMPL/SSD domain